jgi:hypothetical protein
VEFWKWHKGLGVKAPFSSVDNFVCLIEKKVVPLLVAAFFLYMGIRV